MTTTRNFVFNVFTRLTTALAVTVLLSVFVVRLAPDAQAQTSSGDFNLGNQLLRAGEFEEAYDIFKELMDENPRSFAVYDRAVSALVSLRRYEEAVEITQKRMDRIGDDVNTRVRLGEIYHIAGEEEKAVETWNEVLDDHPDNNHAYRRIATTMNERRLYGEAIEVYKRARRQFNDPGMHAFDIADNYLAVSDFESAMEEYLDILGHEQRYQSRIQRQLLNYDEQRLYDIAIVLTEERLEELRSGSEQDLIFREFLVWLNMERQLYRRALAAARTLERYSDDQKHIMFRVGRQLRSSGEYELAEDAFSYYLDLEQHPLQARSYEELSRTYQERAAHLIDNNLDFGGNTDSLYRRAFDTIEQLTRRYPRYERLMQTLVIQAEIALDHLKNPDAAETYHRKMEDAVRDESDEALTYYVEGRIRLFRGEFSMARVAFTRSNRLAESGDIAEKSRYYLGLGDFFNGEFTYARLQLRSLERQNHSWYANNALQLRYMIQDAWEDDRETHEDEPEIHENDREFLRDEEDVYEDDSETGENDRNGQDEHREDRDDDGQDRDDDGQDRDARDEALDADGRDRETRDDGRDTVRDEREARDEGRDTLQDERESYEDDPESKNRELIRYARARYLYETGRYAEASELLTPVLDESHMRPLHSESVLLLGRVLRNIHPEVAYRVIDRHARRPSIRQNAGERLLWERARLAEVVLLMNLRDDKTGHSAFDAVPSGLLTRLFDSDASLPSVADERLLLTKESVVEYYETLLMHYPDGYFSDIARNRIRSIQQEDLPI